MDLPSLDDEGQEGQDEPPPIEYSENKRYARSNVVLGRGAFKTGAGRAYPVAENARPKLHLW